MSTSLAATVSDGPAAATRLSLLGRFRLEQDGRAVRLATRKEEGLLAYLVLHPGSHTRAVLADLYWSDTPEQQAKGSLRAALAGLRAALGPDALLSDREAVQFSPAVAIRVDVLTFRAQATCFLGDAAADPAAFDPDLYRGELLAGHYDDWVLAERERLRQLYLDALLHRVARLAALARCGEAIAAAQRALAADPAEERAHRHLIYLYAVTGNRPAALRQFVVCRRSLKEALDVEPSAETLALLDTISRAVPQAPSSPAARAGEVAAAAAPGMTGAAPRPPGAPLTNLPVPLTSFVGRERELADVIQHLQGEAPGGASPGECRLVTLTGAGGSGKTRLAIQAARQMIAQWPDGVWWADLSLLQDPALLPETVLVTLDLAPPRERPLQALIAFLHERSLLVVLDNCEHMREECAQLVAAVLGSCPHVQVLATSREPLGVPGEQLWPVPSFSVPSATAEPDVEALRGYDAVLLFIERATRQRPAFELTRDNAAQVAEICRRLDGIPLAIELAAARVRTMGLDDILTRLQNRLRLLASGSALSPPRHQTLRASIDWTYNQLTPAECLLLQRLAVFAGGCTLAAAEAICPATGPGGGLAADEVLDTLSRLVDRSLVVAEGGRYRMLETIREYALERLADAGEAEAVRDRHGEYYLALVREQDGRLCSRDQKAALADMTTEISNIRLALEWAIDRHQFAWLRQASFPLLYFYEIRGWYRDGESVFRDAVTRLQNLPALDPDRTVSQEICELDMQTNRAYFTQRVGRAAEAYALHRQNAAQLRALGDETVLRYALRYGGRAAVSLGKWDEAERYLNESHRLSQAADRVWDLGICSAYLGWLARDRGAPEQAQGHYAQAVAVGRRLGDPRLLAFSLAGLGSALLALGQPSQAQELAEQALSLAQETGDRLDLAQAWALFGQIAGRLGEPARARMLLAKSIVIFRETSDAANLASAYTKLGQLALSVDDGREAESHFRTAAAIATELRAEVLAIDALAGLARVFAQEGRAEAALELVAWIERQPAGSGPARDLAQQLRQELAAQLTPDQVEAVELRASAESLEEIVQRLVAGSHTL